MKLKSRLPGCLGAGFSGANPPGCQAHLLGEWGVIEKEAEIEAEKTKPRPDAKRTYWGNGV